MIGPSIIGIFAQGQGSLVWRAGKVTLDDHLWDDLTKLDFCAGGKVRVDIPEAGPQEYGSIKEALRNPLVVRRLATSLGLTGTVYYEDGSQEAFSGS